MFRDLASSSSCQGGNDISRMAESYQNFQRFEGDFGVPQDVRSIDDLLDAQRHEAMDPSIGHQWMPEDFNEFSDFAQFDGWFGPNTRMPPEEVIEAPQIHPAPAAFGPFFRNFFHSLLFQAPTDLHLPPEISLSLSDEQKLKISNRSASLAAHLSGGDTRFAADQLVEAFSKLNIQMDPTLLFPSSNLLVTDGFSAHEHEQFESTWEQGRMESAWQITPQQKQASANLAAMEQIWRSNASQLAHDERWIGEFSGFEGSVKLTDEQIKEMGKVYDSVEDKSEEWAESFRQEQLYQDDEEQEEAQWFSQFLEKGKHHLASTTLLSDEWARQFSTQENHQHQESDQWASDFASRDNRHQTLPSTFDQAERWASDFNSTLRSTSSSSSDVGEKIQNSKFMQFVEKIRSGDVNLESLKSPIHGGQASAREGISSNWADEFSV